MVLPAESSSAGSTITAIVLISKPKVQGSVRRISVLASMRRDSAPMLVQLRDDRL